MNKKDPESPFESYLHTAYQRTIMHDLGMCVERTGSHTVQITLPIQERFHQYSGVVHGGILLLLAESAASILTCLHLDLNTHCALGMQVTANHIRPARSGVLKAVPRILHQGRSTCLCDVSIFAEEDKLVSTARVTLLLRPQVQQGQYEADCQGTRWSKQVETVHLASTQENRFQRSSSRDDREGYRNNRRSDRFGSDRRGGSRGRSNRFDSRGHEGNRSSSRDDRGGNRDNRRSDRFDSDQRGGSKGRSNRFDSRGYEGNRSSSRDDRGGNRDNRRSDRFDSDRRNRHERGGKR
ncbi:MAG: hotdog fold thioesterase [Myxococcota bacterium]